MLLKTSKKTTHTREKERQMQLCMVDETTERNYNFYINIYIITGQANTQNKTTNPLNVESSSHLILLGLST